ncbi:amidase [bacterium]|nr:amidase [bacterium]
MAGILAKFGGRLDEAQKKTVRGDVEANYRRALRLRKQDVDDFEGPATAFVPFAQGLPHEQFQDSPRLVLEPLPGGEPVKNLDSSTAFATIDQLSRGLRAGHFSAVELAEFYLDRLKNLGPRFNCVAALTRETALKQAAAADKRIKAGLALGPLDGIPYGAKDLLAARGYPTTNGCKPYLKRVVEIDSNVVRRLEAAGAVLVAKLAMVECAGGLGYRQANASAFGPGLTPYDTKRWSGGSSSGSGSAVAAGLVPFAIGSETWGSITTPASYCGLTGLRPTYGRVGRSGAYALGYTLDKIGPMARTAADAWQVLLAIAGPDDADASTRFAVWRDLKRPIERPLKLAVLKEGVAKAQPAQKANFEKALAVFREFGEVEEIETPTGTYADVLLTILAGESVSAFEEMVDSGAVTAMTAPEDHIGGYGDRAVSAAEFVRAQRLRGPLCRAFDTHLAPYDAVLTVPTAQTAPLIDKDFGSEFSHKSLGGPGNLCGTPALVLPTGLDGNGLPTSLQIDCRAFGEAVLVRLGHAFQSRTEWHRQSPKLT